MPENYLAMFPVPEDADCVPIMDNARKTLEDGIAAIQQGVPFAPRKKRFLDGLKSGLVNRLFYRFYMGDRYRSFSLDFPQLALSGILLQIT